MFPCTYLFSLLPVLIFFTLVFFVSKSTQKLHFILFCSFYRRSYWRSRSGWLILLPVMLWLGFCPTTIYCDLRVVLTSLLINTEVKTEGNMKKKTGKPRGMGGMCEEKREQMIFWQMWQGFYTGLNMQFICVWGSPVTGPSRNHLLFPFLKQLELLILISLLFFWQLCHILKLGL